MTTMGVQQTLEVATGWLELGLADEALVELESIRGDVKTSRDVLELKLEAQMVDEQWNSASETARILCIKVSHEPRFFLHAAFCLHETGDTLAACNWLMRGPRSLHQMAIFHYNIACYLWTLGQGRRAKSHLHKAISMDEDLVEVARMDCDLYGIGPIPWRPLRA
jgi:hypothetical protein